MKPVQYPLTVFYDASCPLCSSEMCALGSRDYQGRLELVDCSSADFDDMVLAGTPIKRSDLMTLMHARDAHGRWFVGVDAFAVIYRAVGLEGLAQAWPKLRCLYPWIARHRRLLSRLGLARLVRAVISRA